jgi:hypothetical protein
MKKIFTLTIALLMIPFTVFSMDLMSSSEMDSVTGNAGGSGVIEGMGTDQAIETVGQGSAVDGVVAAEPVTDQKSMSLVQGMTVTHGIYIYVYDVSFDLHIQNISGGGSGAAIEAMYADDIIF